MKIALIILAGISIGSAAPAVAQGYNPAGSGSSLGGGGVSDIEPNSSSGDRVHTDRPSARDMSAYDGSQYSRDARSTNRTY